MKRQGPVLALLLLLPVLTACRSQPGNRIVVGSKNFTEQAILTEIVAQLLESRTSLTVERRINLGGTLIAQQAIHSGEIDAYVEYTGTALMVILGDAPSRSKEDVYKRVKAGYASRFGLEVLEPLGFENTFAIVVRGEDARRHKLTKISDLRPHAGQWRAGFGYEFMERPDGYRGLVEEYQLSFGRPPQTVDLGLLYRALAEKQVDVVAGNSTDGAIATLDLTVLEDDLHYFPPYEAVPIVRQETLRQHPEVRTVLDELHGKISEEEMRMLNYAVEGEQKDRRDVAQAFLRSKNL